MHTFPISSAAVLALALGLGPTLAQAEGPAGAAPKDVMKAHPHVATVAAGAQLPRAGTIAPAAGGSIAEVYAQRGTLSGQQVAVRGEVMKFLPRIMGKNWVHLRDGSGDPAKGTADLTVTTTDTVKVGDVVVATGSITVDKDLGGGYAYPVIMEEAHLKVEPTGAPAQ